MKMLTLIFSLVLVTTCIVVEAQVCDILNPCKSWQRCDNGGCVEDTRTCEDDPCIVGPKECYNRLSSSDSNRYVCKCNLDDDVYDHGRGTAYSGAHCSSIHSVNHVQQCYGIQCTTGSFQSPNYPQDHHDNEAVLYLLYIPGAKRIKFRFDEPFYIEKSKDELFIGPGLTCPNAGNLNPDNGTTVDGGNYYLIEGDTAPQHDIIMEGDSAFLYWKTDRTLTFDGWKIRWTAEEIDPCQSEPCMNQGTCQTNAVTGRDVTYDDYTCMCLPCYSGRTCQTYTSPCLSVPCQNAGTCEPKADAPCEYTCTCTDCYLGEQCENLNDQACFPNPCANGGTCSVSPASCRVAICECLGCYTGSTCSQLQDPCSVNPCLNSGQCIATSCTDYRCQCQGCWTGERCSVFGDPCQDSPCQNSGYCIASAGSCTEYQCQCRGCFTGDNCETTMDPCRDDPCMNGGTCTNLGCENRVCTCQGCYTGEDCQILQDPCSPNTCLNGGTCIALGCTVSQCQCPTCYLGTSCERLQDPCAANPCVNGGVCLQQSGSCTAYQCQCFGCWTGTNCQTAQNPCQPNPCRNNGVCNQLACTAYQCTCSGCYTGTQCETLQNPCSPNPCQNGDFCWQQSCTSYTCLCTGQCYTGTNCETLLDPCSPNPCQNGGRCSPSGCENHFCSCVNCYTGSNCETLQDPCANSPCQNGGVCNAETCTRYSCTCSDSCWTGPNCQLRVNPCDANPCRNGGICQQVAGSCTLYECICSNCWSGPTCSELLNPCQPNPCLNGALDLLTQLGLSIKHDLNISKSVTYCSERSVQEMLNILSSVLEEKAIDEMKKSDFYSIMLDETTNVSVTEQLTLNCRFLDSDGNLSVKFLKMIEPLKQRDVDDFSVTLNAETIARHVTDYLREKELDCDKLVGIGTDGASVMTGRHSGVVRRLQDIATAAIGIHCHAHRLQLALVQAANTIPYAKKFTSILRQLYDFYNNSAVRMAGLSAIQSTLHEKQRRLIEPSSTKWLSIEMAVARLKDTFVSVVLSLDREGEERMNTKLYTGQKIASGTILSTGRAIDPGKRNTMVSTGTRTHNARHPIT